MTGEAEHVRPGSQAQAAEAGKLLSRRHSAMRRRACSRIGKIGELVGGSNPAVQGAGAFGGLGGVLGDIRRDLAVGQVSGRGDRPDVVFATPVQGAGRQAGSGRGFQVDDAAAWAMAAVSMSRVAQAGGAVAGPAGPSSRMMAWKWTTPRRWYSATLA